MLNKASGRLLDHQDLEKSFIAGKQGRMLLDYAMPSEIDALVGLAEAVEDALSAIDTLSFQVNLCLEELITNIIKYGLDSAKNHLIHVQIYQHEKYLEIFLKDDAPQFDPFTNAATPDINLDVEHRPIGGLGIFFVKTMMDEAKAYYDGAGNLIVLLKALPSP